MSSITNNDALPKSQSARRLQWLWWIVGSVAILLVLIVIDFFSHREDIPSVLLIGLYAVTAIIGWLIPLILLLYYVPSNRKPSQATAWLLLIFALPVVGLLAFVVLGSPKLSPRRRSLQRKINTYIGAYVAKAAADPLLAPIVAPTVPERYQPFVRLSSALGALPPMTGNAVEVLTDYHAILARMARDIDDARHFVHVEFYIFVVDQATVVLMQALERAVTRGVTVRVLYDPVGSRIFPSFNASRARLQAAGIDAHPTLPIRLRGDRNRWDLRNHRKILVVDGEIAYTGSLNVIQRNYHRRDEVVYDELMARVCGPAADALDAVFRTDWYAETGEQLGAEGNPEHAVELRVGGRALCQVLPSGSGFDNENNLRLYVALIHGAQHKIVICNPYVVPDDALMLALVSAALRGVDVTLYTSEVHDQVLVGYAQRSYYEELLRAGVKLRLYHAPTLLHAKTMTVDDDIAVIGSSNLDMRSFQLNLEVTLVCFNQDVVADMRRAEATYADRSYSLDPDTWRRRPLPARLVENVTRLMSAIL